MASIPMNKLSSAGGTPLYVQCEDTFDFLNSARDFGRRGWMFRGHAVSNFAPGDEWSATEWRLESSLWRHLQEHSGEIAKSSWYPRERDSLRRFKQAAHNYLPHVPDNRSDLLWLALMQHFGSPTRLLDFTFNPAIAAFFAIREATPQKQPWCVHALHIESIRGRAYHIRLNAGTEPTVPKWPRSSDYRVGQKPQNHHFAGIIDGSVMNVRQAAQEGLFMAPSKIDLNIEEWLAAIPPSTKVKPFGTHWIKFVFDSAGYYKSLKQLLQIGMSPARLFPGLEGLAEAMRFTSFDPAKDFDPGDELDIA